MGSAKPEKIYLDYSVSKNDDVDYIHFESKLLRCFLLCNGLRYLTSLIIEFFQSGSIEFEKATHRRVKIPPSANLSAHKVQ